MALFRKIILTAAIFLLCGGFTTKVIGKYVCNLQNHVRLNTLRSPLLVTPNVVINAKFSELIAIHTLSYLYPVHGSCFLINKEFGRVARVVCPGSYLINVETGRIYHFRGLDRTSSVHLVYNDMNGLVSDEYTDFGDVPPTLTCSKEIHPIMKKIDRHYQIGYQLDLLDFLPTMKIFLNVFNNNRILASAKIKFVVHSSSDDSDVRPKDLNYNYQGLLFEEKNVNETLVYSKKYQQLELHKLIVKEILKKRYLADDNYFVKGQLISAQDLYYISEQKCTLFLENIVPVWKSINDGNWRRVGRVIRELAEDTKSDFQVYAGTIDDLVIDNSVINIGNKYAPGDIIAPKLLFKLAFDESAKDNSRGIVFVTVNDPHINLTQTEIYSTSENKLIYLDLPPKDYVKCDNIINCHQSHIEFADTYEGFTYCCSLEDFHYWTELRQHYYNNDRISF